MKYTYVALSTFSLLSNHHLCLSPELSHRLKLNHFLLAILNLYCRSSCLPPSYLLSLKLSTLGISYMFNCLILVHLCWLLSISPVFVRLIQVVACDRIPFIIRLNDVPLYVFTTLCSSMRLLMDIRVVSTFWLLGIKVFWKLIIKKLF